MRAAAARSLFFNCLSGVGALSPPGPPVKQKGKRTPPVRYADMDGDGHLDRVRAIDEVRDRATTRGIRQTDCLPE